MKIMIASDIHGSEYYCEKMLEAYRREKADRLVLLGDLLYHGPRNDFPEKYNPKGVIKLLNSMKEEITAVRGNCDAEVDQMVLEFPIMADYALIDIGGKSLFTTHGHLFNESCLPPMKKGDVLLNGHTHIPVVKDIGEYVFVNPGSVSLPKNGSKNSYVIYDGKFEIKTLD